MGRKECEIRSTDPSLLLCYSHFEEYLLCLSYSSTLESLSSCSQSHQDNTLVFEESTGQTMTATYHLHHYQPLTYPVVLPVDTIVITIVFAKITVYLGLTDSSINAFLSFDTDVVPSSYFMSWQQNFSLEQSHYDNVCL